MSENPVRLETRERALIVTIDNPPVNVVGQAVRAGLLEACSYAWQAIADGLINRVVITGQGKTFVAGADAKEFDGPALDPQLPDVLAELMKLPAIAAINGAALGGGYEIALACRWRIASPAALIGLPEVNLGVIPGSGGTQRLPRLIGLQNALSIIAEGRSVRAEEALSLGMIDEISEDPVAVALACGVDCYSRPPVDELAAPSPSPESVSKARTSAEKRAKHQIAPAEAITLIGNAPVIPIQEGLLAERSKFLELRSGPQARALRHIFFAERAAGPSAAVKSLQPGKIETALVAGGGTMGAAIAYALGMNGLKVTVLEHDADGEARARQNVGALFADGVKRGKLSQEEADAQLLQSFDFLSGADKKLPPVDLAIEAVFEDLGVKRALFERFGRDLPATTILATNTSYLDVNEIGAALPSPQRFLGLHFFAPAHVMKLVEVIRAEATSDQTLASAFALTKRLGKIAVEAGVCDGFIGNRILKRYRQAADVLLIEGALPWTIDAAMEEFGMAMGPYAAQDLSGLDIAYANRQRSPRENSARYVPIADWMVEERKRLGRKTGAGWYDYRDGKPCPSSDVADLIETASQGAGIAREERPAETMSRRLMLAIIAEAFDILDEGIARRPSDIDLVMVHGYGFPRWRGGPMRLADEWGLSNIAGDIADLTERDPASWSVPVLLRRLAEEGKTLSDLN